MIREEAVETMKLELEALKRKCNLYQALIDIVPFPLFAKDEQGKKLIANKKDMFNMGVKTYEEFYGKRDDEIFRNNPAHTGLSQDMRLLKKKELFLSEIELINCEKGEKHPVVTTKYLLIDNGNINGIVGYCQEFEQSVPNLNERSTFLQFGIHNSSVPIFLVREDFSFYDVNAEAHNMLGYEYGELLGKNISFLNPHFEESTQKKIWQEIEEKGKLEYERSHLKKDGTIIEVLIVSKIVTIGEMKLLYATMIDLTEKKSKERDLRRTIERFNFALEAGKMSIWEYDIEKDERFIYENIKELIGNPIDFNDGKYSDPWKYFHNEETSLKVSGHTHQEVYLNKKNRWQQRYQVKNNKGETIHIEENNMVFRDSEGNPKKFFGTIQNITERVKQESRLLLLESVIERMQDAVVVVSTEPSALADEPIVYVNQSYLNMTGYSYDDVIGMTPRILQGVGTDRKMLDKIREAIENWKPVEAVLLNYRKDGTPFWVDISIAPVANEVGWFTHWVSIQRDVTEKVKLESKYKQVANLNQNILSNIQRIFITTDNYGLIINLNAYAEYVFGVKNEDVAGVRNISSLLKLEEGMTLEWDEILKRINDHEEWEITNNLGIKRTYMFSTDALTMLENLPSGHILYGTDISDEKLKNEELGMYKKAIDKHFMVKLLDASGNVVMANEKLLERFKYTRDEVIGKHHSMFQNMNEELWKVFAQVKLLLQKGEVFQGIGPRVDKNGKEMWIEGTVTPFISPLSKQLEYILMIMNDITELRQSEMEKATLVKQLSANNYDLQQFGFVVAHNLRAPLTNILSSVKMLEKDKGLSLMSEKLLTLLKESTKATMQTLDDLGKVLLVKKESNTQKEWVSFNDYVNHIIQKIQHLINTTDTEFLTDIREEKVLFNHVYMESVMFNLVENAIKYRSPNRRPRVEVKTFKDENGVVCLSVSDNGLGLDLNKVKDKLFKFQQRFHGNSDARGIGLFLVHSQITTLGGSISVESEVDKGTTFLIRFSS